MVIYNGETFKSGMKCFNYLTQRSIVKKIEFKKQKFIEEKTIFKGDIGRIRDIKIHQSGDIYLISDNGELWRMYK